MAETVAIGGANLDIRGKSTGVLLSATSNPGAVTIAPGGVARNIAAHLGDLDMQAALISVIGSDEAGDTILDSVRNAHVDVAMVKRIDGRSGIYLALLNEEGQLAAAIADTSCVESLTPVDLEARSKRLASASLIVADCNLSVECLDWLFIFAARHAVRLLVEPVSIPKSQKLRMLKPRDVFAITPNGDQLAALTGRPVGNSKAISELHAMGYRNIVVHCGGKGALVSDGRAPPVEVSASSAGKIADVTGAGDAAVAGLICGIIGGKDLVDSAKLGQAAAAIRIAAPANKIDRAQMVSLAGIP
jgi:pseudouridine kinase